MSAAISVSKLTLNNIESKALNFSAQYNLTGDLPFPIDHIIEDILGLHIIPIHQLAQNNTDGFLSSDLKSISIDRDTFLSNEFRYRLILAHEIGHKVLHSNLYSSTSIKSQTEYLAFIEDIGSKQYARIEYQAQEFSKYILVPSSDLDRKFNDAVSMIKTNGNLDLTKDRNIELALESVSRYLQVPFNVSEYVIAKCIERDDLFI